VRGDGGRIGSLSPRRLQAVDRRPHRFADRREALAELAVAEHEQRVARRQHVGERGLHGAGAGSAEQENVARRAEHAGKRSQRLSQNCPELRPPMRQHRLRAR